MPNIKFVRKELKDMLPLYDTVRDCLDGEVTVKSKGTKYLPQPNASDTSAENALRYKSYKTRAVFYGATKRTLGGLCGQVFTRDPIIKVPAELQPVEADADGGGVSLLQLSKRAAKFVIGYGRAGILVDYPTVDNTTSKKALIEGDVRPTITLYDPYQVINWRTKKRGARELLSLVVLQETYIKTDDGFEAEEETQWRVLRLEGNVYTYAVYRVSATTKGEYQFVDGGTPKDATGKPLTEIPFSFIGAENNDSAVDAPPLYDIASLNIAHYRNSADYEESCFITGQPTPYFTGLTQDWVENVLKGVVTLGARGAVSLPVGADAGLLQAASNTMPFEAMKHKEEQMAALGARFVEKKGTGRRTATEAAIDDTAENSILASTAKNISAAFALALQWCAVFAGADQSEIAFELNTDFDLAAMSPEDRRQLMQEWQGGLVAWEEARKLLRKSGIASMDDNDARDIIKEELAELSALDQQDTNVGA